MWRAIDAEPGICVPDLVQFVNVQTNLTCPFPCRSILPLMTENEVREHAEDLCQMQWVFRIDWSSEMNVPRYRTTQVLNETRKQLMVCRLGQSVSLEFAVGVLYRMHLYENDVVDFHLVHSEIHVLSLVPNSCADLKSVLARGIQDDLRFVITDGSVGSDGSYPVFIQEFATLHNSRPCRTWYQIQMVQSSDRLHRRFWGLVKCPTQQQHSIESLGTSQTRCLDCQKTLT